MQQKLTPLAMWCERRGRGSISEIVRLTGMRFATVTAIASGRTKSPNASTAQRISDATAELGSRLPVLEILGLGGKR